MLTEKKYCGSGEERIAMGSINRWAWEYRLQTLFHLSVCSVHMMYVHLCMFAFVFEFTYTCAAFGWHMHASTHINTVHKIDKI